MFEGIDTEISLHGGVVRELPEFTEGIVHLSSGAFEEPTATSDE